jgi:DNA-binding MarR family transcriptional regulator
LTDVLKNFVPFLLYRVMAKSVTLAAADFAGLGLSIQEARVLIVLLHNPGIRVGALADFTCIEQSAMSHMLRRLSRDKLVIRERVAADNRSVEIRLSPKGQRVAQKCHQFAISHSDLLLNDVSAADATLLRQVLRQMYENAVEWAERKQQPGSASIGEEAGGEEAGDPKRMADRAP